MRSYCPVVAGLVGLVLLAASCAGATSERRAGSTPEPPSPTPTSPSPSAAQTPSPPATRTTTVTVVGDVMLGRRVGRSLADGDPGRVFAPTRQRLARADVTIGTLESTLSRLGPPTQGGDSFAASPRMLGPLRAAGFDVLSLANNHVGDYGVRSLLDTVRRVRGAGLAPVGAGADAAEAWRPAVVERDGVRIGIVAFNAIGETPRAGASSPGAASVAMPPRTGPLSTADLNRARRAVAELRRTVDIVLAMPHWGQQYTHRPVAAQRRVGRVLVEAGASAVIGGHPHWVQKVEVRRRTPIVHSLGNFVFDMDWERQVREGVALELSFREADLTSAKLAPYRIGDDFTPRWVSGAAARQILREMGVPADGRIRLD